LGLSVLPVTIALTNAHGFAAIEILPDHVGASVRLILAGEDTESDLGIPRRLGDLIFGRHGHASAAVDVPEPRVAEFSLDFAGGAFAFTARLPLALLRPRDRLAGRAGRDGRGLSARIVTCRASSGVELSYFPIDGIPDAKFVGRRDAAPCLEGPHAGLQVTGNGRATVVARCWLILILYY
jgi:hypothetical protein